MRITRKKFFEKEAYSKYKMRIGKAVFLLKKLLNWKNQEEKRLFKLKIATNIKKNTEKLFS